MLRKHSLIEAETPPDAEKTPARQKAAFRCYKNFVSRVLKKHRRCGENLRSSKNTYCPGAEKTPWMLRKHQVLKKHHLDAEKVLDAGIICLHPFRIRLAD